MTLGEVAPADSCPGAVRRTGNTVYLKFEGMNPTGSFKDRGMTSAMTAANRDGAKAVVCASTGNTSPLPPQPTRCRPAYLRRAGSGRQDFQGKALPGDCSRRRHHPN